MCARSVKLKLEPLEKAFDLIAKKTKLINWQGELNGELLK